MNFLIIGFETEYFGCSEDEEKFCEAKDGKIERSIIQAYKSVLNSKATEETLVSMIISIYGLYSSHSSTCLILLYLPIV